MSKQKPRTKGNVKPSSSAKAATALSTSGFSVSAKNSFLGFDALQEESSEDLSPDLQAAFRQTFKRDPVTRLKALQQVEELLSIDCSAVDLDGAAACWPRFYQRLSIDSCSRVREASHVVLGKLTALLGKRLQAHLRSVLPSWVLGMHDPSQSPANSARAAFNATFSEAKQPAAIEFAGSDIMNYCIDTLVREDKMKPIDFDAEVETLEDRRSRLSCAALSSISYVLHSSSSSCPIVRTRLFDDQKVLKIYGKHKQVNIRSLMCSVSFYTIGNTKTEASETFVKTHALAIFSFMNSVLDENASPGLAVPAWELLLLLSRDYRESLAQHMNIRKSLMPKVCAVCRRLPCSSAARSIAPCMLPLLSKLSPEVDGCQIVTALHEGIEYCVRTDVNVRSQNCSIAAAYTALVECRNWLFENAAEIDKCLLNSQIAGSSKVVLQIASQTPRSNAELVTALCSGFINLPIELVETILSVYIQLAPNVTALESIIAHMEDACMIKPYVQFCLNKLTDDMICESKTSQSHQNNNYVQILGSRKEETIRALISPEKLELLHGKALSLLTADSPDRRMLESWLIAKLVLFTMQSDDDSFAAARKLVAHKKSPVYLCLLKAALSCGSMKSFVPTFAYQQEMCLALDWYIQAALIDRKYSGCFEFVSDFLIGETLNNTSVPAVAVSTMEHALSVLQTKLTNVNEDSYGNIVQFLLAISKRLFQRECAGGETDRILLCSLFNMLLNGYGILSAQLISELSGSFYTGLSKFFACDTLDDAQQNVFIESLCKVVRTRIWSLDKLSTVVEFQRALQTVNFISDQVVRITSDFSIVSSVVQSFFCHGSLDSLCSKLEATEGVSLFVPVPENTASNDASSEIIPAVFNLTLVSRLKLTNLDVRLHASLVRYICVVNFAKDFGLARWSNILELGSNELSALEKTLPHPNEGSKSLNMFEALALCQISDSCGVVPTETMNSVVILARMTKPLHFDVSADNVCLENIDTCLNIFLQKKNAIEHRLLYGSSLSLETSIDDILLCVASMNLFSEGVSAELSQPLCDMILCSLISWLQTLESLCVDEMCSSRYVAFCVSLCDLFLSCVKAASHAEPGSNFLSEWNEFFLESSMGTLLKVFLAAIEKQSGSSFISNVILDRLSACVVCATKDHLDKMEIKSILCPDLDCRGYSAKLQSWITVLLPHMASPHASVQLAVFHLIGLLLDEAAGTELKALAKDDSESESGDAFVVTQSPTLPSFLLSKVVTDLEGDVENFEQTGMVFSNRHVTHITYMQSWRLILKFCSHMKAAHQSEYLETLRRQSLHKILLYRLFALLPDAESRNFSLSEPAFHFHPFKVAEYDAGVSTLLQDVAFATYTDLLRVFPTLVRQQLANEAHHFSKRVLHFTAVHVSPAVLDEDFAALTQSVHNLNLTCRRVAREVIAEYRWESDEISMELVLALPEEWPLGQVTVDCAKRVGIPKDKWRRWMLQLQTYFMLQNGSVLDALKLWSRAVDKHLAGVDDCMICMTTVHATDYKLPRITCKQCSKKFHSSCLYKWFSTSNNTSCPLCRKEF